MTGAEVKCPTCGVLGCKDVADSYELVPSAIGRKVADDGLLCECVEQITHMYCRNGHGMLLRFERRDWGEHKISIDAVDR